jgi:hypothetical protein
VMRSCYIPYISIFACSVISVLLVEKLDEK